MDWITQVVQAINELPYESTEGRPNVMQVTEEELRIILERSTQYEQLRAQLKKDATA